MLQGDLSKLIYTKPFRPFRIIMSDGASYDIRHRESFVQAPTMMTVGLLPSTGGETHERIVILDLFSITTIEPLPVTPAAAGNGQASS